MLNLTTSTLLKSVRYFRDIVYAELPLQQLELFLTVSENEGITQPELEVKLDSPQGTISRNVKKLSVYLVKDKDTGNKVKEGHDLLETRPDASNSRQQAVYLSQHGKDVLAGLSKVLGV